MNEALLFGASDQIVFVKDYEALSIPTAESLLIRQGTAGIVTQALGGNYTIRLDTAVLVRVPGRDGDVLARRG